MERWRALFPKKTGRRAIFRIVKLSCSLTGRKRYSAKAETVLRLWVCRAHLSISGAGKILFLKTNVHMHGGMQRFHGPCDNGTIKIASLGEALRNTGHRARLIDSLSGESELVLLVSMKVEA